MDTSFCFLQTGFSRQNLHLSASPEIIDGQSSGVWGRACCWSPLVGRCGEWARRWVDLLLESGVGGPILDPEGPTRCRDHWSPSGTRASQEHSASDVYGPGCHRGGSGAWIWGTWSAVYTAGASLMLRWAWGLGTWEPSWCGTDRSPWRSTVLTSLSFSQTVCVFLWAGLPGLEESIMGIIWIYLSYPP